MNIKKKTLDENFKEYNNTKIDDKILNKKSFGWHLDGLIINSDDENSLECKDTSEINEKNAKNDKGKFICEVQMGRMLAFHTHYYGYKMSDFYKAEIFKYHLEEISCSLKDLLEIYGDDSIPIPWPFRKSIKNPGKFLQHIENSLMGFYEFFGLSENDKNINNNESIEENKGILKSNFVCYYFLKLFRYFGGIR